MGTYGNPSAADVATLFNKFDDPDSDIRYMTLVDLNKLLTTGSPSFLIREQSTCNRLIDHLVRLLDDSNGDVQSQALKCLGPFSAKISSELLAPFLEWILNLRTVKSQDASIPATAARTLVLSFPHPLAGVPYSKSVTDAYLAVSNVLLPRLTGRTNLKADGKATKGKDMLSTEGPKGADIDAIDLLSDVVRCFGVMLHVQEIENLQKKLTNILDDSKTGSIAKKRTVAALSILSAYMSDPLLSQFVSSTIESFRESHITPAKRRLLISLIGAVARAIPRRFGPYLQVITPFVLSAVSQAELDKSLEAHSEGNHDPLAEETQEAAFVALDEFISCCPIDIVSFTDEIIDSGIRYVTYDPAVVEDDEELDEAVNEEEDFLDGEEEDYEQEEVLDDDEDASWKIRRSASKMLYKLISVRGNELIEGGVVYERIAPVLIKAFKEREESVRLEILAAITLIIKKTIDTVAPLPLATGRSNLPMQTLSPNPRKRRRGDSNPGILEEHIASQGFASPIQLSSPTSSSRKDLLKLGTSILSGLTRLLSQKLVPTKQAAVVLLQTYVQVRHDSLTDYLSKVLEPLIDSIQESQAHVGAHAILSSSTGSAATSTTLRIESLQLLGVIFDTHSSKSVAPYLDRVIQGLVYAIDDKYFKIAGEALKASESIIRALTPPRAFGYDEKSAEYVEKMFDVVLKKAQSNEVDLEVRHRAIHALGICLARTAETPQNLSGRKRKDALLFLQERLKNEMTRIATIGAVDMVLGSSGGNSEDMNPEWIQHVAMELANQLRKADRRLRGSSLAAIRRLASNATACDALDNDTLQMMTTQLLPLVRSDNLHHLTLAVLILTNLVQKAPQVVVSNEVNSRICEVVIEPLSGHTLEAFLSLIEAIGAEGVGAPLMTSLLRAVGVNGDPSVVGTVIGTLLVAGGTSLPITTEHILHELSTKQDDQRVALSLFILGEIGLRQGSPSNIKPDIFLKSLQSRSDSVQRAAAIALGRAGAGNTRAFLPVILGAAKSTGNAQSLILYSIKELLQQGGRASANISTYSQEIWNKLMEISGSTDNKVVGAECIGRLAATEPVRYLPLLQSYLSDASPSVRSMVIQAVRFALSDSDEAVDDALKPSLLKMLTVMLNDADLENRRLAMTTVYSAARHKPGIILPSLGKLLPYIIKAAEINPNLVREVQMGPFKHKVDDGLETRKGAYETLHALLDMAYARMNHLDLFDRVIAGLRDEHDVRMLSMLMLTKLMHLDPDETARHLDTLAGPFQEITSTKLKENAVKQEVEKLQEAVKDVLIVTVRLQSRFPQVSIPTAGNPQGQAWRAYIEYLKKDFASQLQNAEAEVKIQE